MSKASHHNCEALLATMKSGPDFCAEADRYALYLQYGCPFAQRVNIVLQMKGLQDIIPVITLDSTKTPEGFRFTGKLGTHDKDPYYGFSHIRQLYWKENSDYKGPFIIPMLWDRKTEVVVSNESGDIMRMLEESFDHLLPIDRQEANRPGGRLCPEVLRPEIEAMNKWIQSDINACVYDIVAATDQESYDDRIKTLFSALDRVEDHLATPGSGPFLFGESITETDIRLFTSIVRFDIVYYTTFHCSLKLIRYNYLNLYKWMQQLYWDDSPLTNGAFKSTTRFDHIKILYSAWAPNNIVYASSEPPMSALAKYNTLLD